MRAESGKGYKGLIPREGIETDTNLTIESSEFVTKALFPERGLKRR